MHDGAPDSDRPASDVVDAGVVLLAVDGDEIITVDLEDFELLAAPTGRHVKLFRP